MKILVTGSEGFIGKYMISCLTGENVLARKIIYEIDSYDVKIHDQFPKIEKYDAVMHFGAISSTTETDVNKIKHYNNDLSKRIIDECIKHNILLQISSTASFYEPKYGISSKESDKINPKSLYSKSKALLEDTCNSLKNEKNYKIQIFRYFNVFSNILEEHKGEQASPHYRFRKTLEKGEKIKLFHGSDKILRDFIHVEDVCDAQMKFLNIPEYDTWNIGSGKATSFKDVAASVIMSKYPQDNYENWIEYIDIPENLKYHYQYYTCADLTKLNETLSKYYGENKDE